MNYFNVSLSKAILLVAFIVSSSGSYAQNPQVISKHNKKNAQSVDQKSNLLLEQTNDRYKLILEKRKSIKSLIVKEDSLKSSIDNIDKEIKKNLSERDQLANNAAALSNSSRSKEWIELNNNFKEKIKEFAILAKKKQVEKTQLQEVQKQKEEFNKIIQQEEFLITELKDKNKEGTTSTLSGN